MNWSFQIDPKSMIPVYKQIVQNVLVGIDKSVPGLKEKYAAVFQDFEVDIYNGLSTQYEKISSFKRFVFSCSKGPFQFVIKISI